MYIYVYIHKYIYIDAVAPLDDGNLLYGLRSFCNPPSLGKFGNGSLGKWKGE